MQYFAPNDTQQGWDGNLEANQLILMFLLITLKLNLLMDG